MQEQHGRHLRERLEHHHAREHGRPWKMTLKEFLVDRNVLDGDQTTPGVVLGDRVHEKRRLPIAEAVEEDGNVQHDQTNANCKTLIADLFSNLHFAISNGRAG
jgi:hypothetical protein